MQSNQISQNTIQLQQKWKAQLENITHILNYLMTYPKLADKLGLYQSITHKEVSGFYAEYLYVHERLNTQPEIDFFKDHWFCVNEVYIDMNNENLPMFYAEFIGLEDGQWMVNPITDNINLFIRELDNPDFDLKNHFHKVSENIVTLTRELYNDFEDEDEDIF